MSEFGLSVAPNMIIRPADQRQHSHEKRWDSTLQEPGTSFSAPRCFEFSGCSDTCFDVDETVHVVRQLWAEHYTGPLSSSK